MADEPVLAWHEPFWRKLRRWITRNRTLVTTAAVAVVSLSPAVSFAIYNGRLRTANSALQNTNRDLRIARNEAETYLYTLGISQADAAWRDVKRPSSSRRLRVPGPLRR